MTHAFAILGDPVRRRIVQLLGPGDRTSGAIVAVIRREFGITQSAVSQHLRVLRDGGLATSRVDGPRRFYSLEMGPLQAIDRWLDPFRTNWNQRLDALATEVARGKRERRTKPTAVGSRRPRGGRAA